MTVTLEGQLEVDVDRGVIYFHNNKNGATTLRICRLYVPNNFDENTQVDVTCNAETLVMATRLDNSLDEIARRAWARKDKGAINLIESIRKDKKDD